jgi:hypothetical protein
MRPGPEAQQRSTIAELAITTPSVGDKRVTALVSLSEEQRRIIEVLQAQQHGVTARQLQTRLEWPGDRVQRWLDSLLERQVVARLNTIIPSYIYRYGGVDLDAD